MDEVEVVAPSRFARKRLLKSFAPADCADQWRAYFASKLGLGAIPKGEPGELVPAPSGEAIMTSEQLGRGISSRF